MSWMTLLPWLSGGSLAAFAALLLPYLVLARPDFEAIYARFCEQEPRLWRAKGGPVYMSLIIPNQRKLGEISRLVRDLEGVTDPVLLAHAKSLRGWAQYETWLLMPLFLTSMLSGLAWVTLRQMTP